VTQVVLNNDLSLERLLHGDFMFFFFNFKIF
jgi:hypothetical protein